MYLTFSLNYDVTRSSSSGLISEEGFCYVVHFLFNNCSEIPYRSRYFCQESLSGRTCNSLQEPYMIKMKTHTVQIFILNNFCSILLFKLFFVFDILELKDLQSWPQISLITERMTLITVWQDPGVEMRISYSTSCNKYQ